MERIILSDAEFDAIEAAITDTEDWPRHCRCGEPAGHEGWSECFHRALDEIDKGKSHE